MDRFLYNWDLRHERDNAQKYAMLRNPLSTKIQIELYWNLSYYETKQSKNI